MTPINANDFLIPEIFRVYSRLPAVGVIRGQPIPSSLLIISVIRDIRGCLLSPN